MTLNELEALADSILKDHPLSCPDLGEAEEAARQIKRLIALVRLQNEALTQHGAPYYKHGVAWDEALAAFDAFERNE